MKTLTKADIVLLTVNQHEQDQLHLALGNKTQRTASTFQGDSNEIYYNFGKINGQRVFTARATIGSTGTGASFDTVSNSISDLDPSVIIAVGIAWGAHENSTQDIGHILLSNRLRDAQHHKVKADGVELRGDITSAPGTLVKAFSTMATTLSKKYHEGTLLSIETLFDNKEHRDNFVSATGGQAIGGEMEGVGLLMALQRATEKRIDWLIVKGICDWGFKKNVDAQQKEINQTTAAREASELCVETINSYRLVRGQGSSSQFKDISHPASNPIDTTPAIEDVRSIKNTVQAYISKNASLTIDLDYPVVHKDYQNKIIFEFYKLTDDLGALRSFLYVHEAANQSATLGYLQHHKHLPTSGQLVVLSEKPSNLRDSERRKNNLKSVFGTQSVFFIDEFGSQFLYRDQLRGFIPFNLPIYVEGFAEASLSEQSDSALQQLKAWYKRPSSPLLIVKGYGGIGKTTLVKQFLDDVHEENSDVGILFIDSHEIIGELETRSRLQEKIDDIYDFYHAQSTRRAEIEQALSKDLLSLSVDNGSLVIVLDGIDEVIAKLGQKFDSVNFVNSISTNYATNLRKTKILITCRDYFWDSQHNNTPIEKLELQPFNQAMAEEFFTKSIEGGKIERAMAMANKFGLRNTHLTEVVYVPYILDLIVYLIKQKQDLSQDDPSTPSSAPLQLLSLKNSNDFLVAHVCNREIVKLNSLPVTTQIAFFTELSVAKNGQISIYDIKQVLARISGQGADIDENEIERLKGHPLLSARSSKVGFRYDFFNEYFKSLFIVKYFLGRNIEELNTELIEAAADYLRFDNEFTNSVCERLVYSDELSLFFAETIDILKKNFLSKNNSDSATSKRACSGIFCLYLNMLRTLPQKFDVNVCTLAMKDYFQENDTIIGLTLMNVGSNSSSKPIFDFRGIKLRNCHFEHFDFFWECLVDENTRFEACTFNLLEPRKDIRPLFFSKTFSNECNTAGIAHLIAKQKENLAQETMELKSNLEKLFNLFASRGNFYPQKQEYIKSKTFTGPYLPTLIKNKVVVTYIDPQKPTMNQYRVGPDYLQILKHLDQGTPSIEFDRVVKLFSK